MSRNGRNAISPVFRHFWKVSRNGRNTISPVYRHFLLFFLFLDSFLLFLDPKVSRRNGNGPKLWLTRGPNNLLDVKISRFWPDFEILTKFQDFNWISGFNQILEFCPNFRFHPNFRIWTKFQDFYQTLPEAQRTQGIGSVTWQISFGSTNFKFINLFWLN